MKRFLKPTGRILTTAVFTTTAFETLIPNTAVPAPVPDPLPPDTTWQETPTNGVPERASTIIPPEALSAQEFAQTPSQETASLHSDVDLSPYVPELPTPIQQAVDPWETELADTSPSLPPIQFALQTIPELDSSPTLNAPDPSFEHRQSLGQEHIEPRQHAHNDPDLWMQSLSSTVPDVSNIPLPNSPNSSSLDGNHGIANTSETIPVMPIENDSPLPSNDPQLSSTAAPPAVPTETSDDVMAATREWLNEALSDIVTRDRMDRESLLRDNLMASAHEYLAQGAIEQVQRIVDNPALTEGDREELLSAIAETETASPTYPFVSVEQARSITRQSVRHQSLPSRDWLLTQMDNVVTTLNPHCDIDNQTLLSASTSTDIPGLANRAISQANTTRFSPNTGTNQATFLSGSAFLAGVGHQPPSFVAKSGTPPIQSSQNTARQESDCTPTIGQNIGGLTVATLSGYQWLDQFSRTGGAMRMVLPLAIPASITSHFGWRTHPIHGNRRFHFGIDFGAAMGTPILAAIPGRVETSHYLDGYGLTVILENQDLEQRTLYAHMSGIAVQPGTWVEQGDVIGWVGSTGHSTGPHLHFEVHERQGNDWVAVDPLQAAAQLIANRGNTRIQ